MVGLQGQAPNHCFVEREGKSEKGQAAGLGTGAGTLGLRPHSQVQGTGKNDAVLFWGRSGVRSSGLGALVCREECTQAKAAFPHCWETSTLDSGSPLSCPGKQPDGPHPTSRCWPGQLKQADKGKQFHI